jgi:cyclopropane fatty-acyl-phospholipid synthase-like methyltransferase
MDHYSETSETWNKLALQYEALFMDLHIYDESYDAFCNALSKPGSRLLEIGCGPGNITKYVLKKRPDLKILGTDVSPAMIERARINNPGNDFKVMDCRDLDALEYCFDGIVSGFCLPYLSGADVSGFITACAKHLETGGILYLSFVPGDPRQSAYQVNSQGDRMFFNYHAPEKVSALLSLNHFETLKSFSIIYKNGNKAEQVHSVMIARKKVNEDNI